MRKLVVVAALVAVCLSAAPNAPVGVWKADLEKTKDQVARDHAEGERVDVAATPTLFINGRQYHGPHQYEDVKDWIDEELNK